LNAPSVMGMVLLIAVSVITVMALVRDGIQNQRKVMSNEREVLSFGR